MGEWTLRHLLLLIPPDNSVHHENTDDDTEVNPVLETTGEDDSKLHDVKDRAAKVRDELDELVLGRTASVSANIRNKPQNPHLSSSL